MSIVVRPRVDADADDLLRIAAAVHVTDGYPGRTPTDMRSFIVSPDVLLAWVAEFDGAVVGHVAVYRESMPVVMARAAAALGREASELAAVARLIVDPGTRRLGVGRALLEAATKGVRERGLHPILEVVTDFSAANALYHACGWRNAGEVTLVFADGGELQCYVWVAPDA